MFIIILIHAWLVNIFYLPCLFNVIAKHGHLKVLKLPFTFRGDNKISMVHPVYKTNNYSREANFDGAKMGRSFSFSCCELFFFFLSRTVFSRSVFFFLYTWTKKENKMWSKVFCLRKQYDNSDQARSTDLQIESPTRTLIDLAMELLPIQKGDATLLWKSCYRNRSSAPACSAAWLVNRFYLPCLFNVIAKHGHLKVLKLPYTLRGDNKIFMVNPFYKTNNCSGVANFDGVKMGRSLSF